MESFAGLSQVVLGKAARGETRVKLLRRKGDGPERGRSAASNIGGGSNTVKREKGKRRAESKVNKKASKSGSKMQTSWKIVKAKMLQM